MFARNIIRPKTAVRPDWNRPAGQGVAMIAKKMLMWVAAGTLSVASIPAIGATVSHHVKSHRAKPALVTHHVAVKTTAKHVKPTVLAVHHVKKMKHVKQTTHAKATASHGTMGVLAMHSGHASLVKPVVHKTTAS